MGWFHVKQETPAALAFLEPALVGLESVGLLRSRNAGRARGLVSFCSNDYLGLAGRPAPAAASGAGAARLVSGDLPIHHELEQMAAELVAEPTALVFTSGYAANVGLLASLAGPGDLIVSDALNHASIIDGARLSRARVAVVPHLELSAVDSALRTQGPGRSFVVTESYFSMDADSPDLKELRGICDARGAALLVDEAHALGVLGPGGRGLCAAAGIHADALVGTFGKAFGAGGAFVAGCTALTTWLWNRARSFVFSTGLSPSVSAAALAGLRAAAGEADRRVAVAARSGEFRARLLAMGLLPGGHGHIVPWVIGRPEDALRAAAVLAECGVDVRAIRPPSVPTGTARLRFTLSATHTGADVERAAEAVAEALRQGIACAPP
jgi:8-amino-7-oxononanoate synthase